MTWKRFNFFLWLATGLSLSATQINWYCPPHSANETAEGQVLGSGFQFELGVFKQGFTPTAENMDQWAANWVPAQRTQYHEGNQWFTSVFKVEDNTGEFTVGREAWIWGFAGSPEDGEWILFRNTTWRWPRANPRNPIQISWRSTDANEFLVGGAGGAGSFRTAAVQGQVPPTTTWQQWRYQQLGGLVDQEGGDLNGNGIADLLEYVLGADAAGDLLDSRIEVRVTKEGDQNHLELLVPRRADRPAVFEIEMSRNLEDWQPARTFMQLHQSTPSSLIYRDNGTALVTLGPWFWRYQVTPAE